MSNENLTKLMISKWRTNPIIKNMKEAEKYYEVENIKIEEKSRNYKDSNGRVIINSTMSNAKIPSGFLRQSVNQKVSYGFGKPFVYSIDKIDDSVSDSVIEEYEKEWRNFITPQLRKEIKSLARETINNGIGFVFPSIDAETGMLEIINLPSKTLYPKWTNNQHRKLDALVRDYTEDVYDMENNEVKTVNRVEFWDSETCEKYIADGNDLTPDTNDNGEYITSHLVSIDGSNIGWGRVPFMWLKSSDDEMPLLKLIKRYIDEYDYLNSKSADSLIDDIDAIIVLKGLSSEIKDLQEARELLSKFKITSVDEGGDVSFLQTNANITAIQEKLDQYKADIKEFSCTVNTQDIEFGSNPSGVALKSAYQDLDIYMNDIETEFELFIEQLKYFFDKWQVMLGNFREEDLTKIKITVSLDRDMMINETELIDNTAKLSGLVSQETLDNYNPAVESHDIERERRENEEENITKKETTEQYNFGDIEDETEL